jgi:hypothetical protein
MQVLEQAQASKSFNEQVEVLMKSLNRQSTHMRQAVLGNLLQYLSACPSETASMISAHEISIPPCQCALPFQFAYEQFVF